MDHYLTRIKVKVLKDSQQACILSGPSSLHSSFPVAPVIATIFLTYSAPATQTCKCSWEMPCRLPHQAFAPAVSTTDTFLPRSPHDSLPIICRSLLTCHLHTLFSIVTSHSHTITPSSYYLSPFLYYIILLVFNSLLPTYLRSTPHIHTL